MRLQRRFASSSAMTKRKALSRASGMYAKIALIQNLGETAESSYRSLPYVKETLDRFGSSLPTGNHSHRLLPSLLRRPCRARFPMTLGAYYCSWSILSSAFSVLLTLYQAEHLKYRDISAILLINVGLLYQTKMLGACTMTYWRTTNSQERICEKVCHLRQAFYRKRLDKWF